MPVARFNMKARAELGDANEFRRCFLQPLP